MDFNELKQHNPVLGRIPNHEIFKELVTKWNFSGIRLAHNSKAASIEKGWQLFCDKYRNWADIQLQPKENMGIAVGPASSIIVVDVDDINLFSEYMEQNNIKIDTRIHKTPKGWHLLYQNKNINLSSNKLILKHIGIEVMFNHMQVVAPGSVVQKENGHKFAYVTYCDTSPAPVPDWLNNLINNNVNNSTNYNINYDINNDINLEDSTDVGKGPHKAKLYLDSYLELVKQNPLPPNTERNEYLYKTLLGARRVGANSWQLQKFARQYASLVGISMREADGCVRSALKVLINNTDKLQVFKNIEKPREIELNLDIEEFMDAPIGEKRMAHATLPYMLNRYRYYKQGQTWYENRSNIWVALGKGILPDITKPIIEYFDYYIQVTKLINKEVSTFLSTQSVHYQSYNKACNLVNFVKTLPQVQITANQMDNNRMMLPFKNAVVEFFDNKPILNVRPIEAKDYLTKTLPFDWPGPWGECHEEGLRALFDENAEKFCTMLDDMFAMDEGVNIFISKLLGYSITGTSLKLKKMPIFVGHGDNGKTILFTTLQHSLYPFVRTITKDIVVGSRKKVGGDPELLALKGTRIGLISETEDTDYINESTVKALTGGDIRTARALYDNEMQQIHPVYTVILATNHLPRITSATKALWNRILPIPFNTRFTEDVPKKKWELPMDASLKTWAEQPHIGVVIYLLLSWIEYCKNGLSPEPAAVKQTLQKYKTEESAYPEFIEECLTPVSIPEQHLRGTRLATAYRNWANDNQVNLPYRISNRSILKGLLFYLNEKEGWEIKEGWERTKGTTEYYAVYGICFLSNSLKFADPRPIKK